MENKVRITIDVNFEEGAENESFWFMVNTLENKTKEEIERLAFATAKELCKLKLDGKARFKDGINITGEIGVF